MLNMFGNYYRGKYSKPLSIFIAFTLLYVQIVSVAGAGTGATVVEAEQGAKQGYVRNTMDLSASGSTAVQFSSVAAEDKLTYSPPPNWQSYQVKDYSSATTLPSTGIKLGVGDWLIKLPQNSVIDAPIGLNIGMVAADNKPHNVVIIGGEIRVTGPDASGFERAMYVNNWTGTFYMEGVKFYSANDMLGEGIDTYAPGGEMILQNVDIGLLHGSYSTNHADGLQVWNGPYSIKIDGLDIKTMYQGMFLLPEQHYTAGVYPTDGVYEFHRVHIDSTDPASAYSLWKSDTFSVTNDRVYVDAVPSRVVANQVLWPSGGWNGVQVNVPHGSVFTAEPGVGYVSPGYQ